MAGGIAGIEWFPRHFKQRGAAASGGVSKPPAETGETPQGHRIRQTAGYPTRRLDPQQPRLTTGDRRNGETEVPLTKGTPREQCRRRPQGRNGCEEDDRSSDPRFRSAPTERQASVGCEEFLTNRRPLVPDQADRLAAVPCPILPLPPPDPRPGRCRGHSADCARRPLVHTIFTGSPPRIAPHSALVSENAGQKHRTRPLYAPPRTQFGAPDASQMANTAARHQALQLDDRTGPVRDVRSVFLSAGPEMAGSLLPAIVNLLDADGAVSPVRAAAPAEDPRSGLTR